MGHEWDWRSLDCPSRIKPAWMQYNLHLPVRKARLFQSWGRCKHPIPQRDDLTNVAMWIKTSANKALTKFPVSLLGYLRSTNRVERNPCILDISKELWHYPKIYWEVKNQHSEFSAYSTSSRPCGVFALTKAMYNVRRKGQYLSSPLLPTNHHKSSDQITETRYRERSKQKALHTQANLYL